LAACGVAEELLLLGGGMADELARKIPVEELVAVFFRVK